MNDELRGEEASPAGQESASANRAKVSVAAHSVSSDDFSSTPPSKFRAKAFKLFEFADDIMHLLVGALLVVVAAVVLLNVILTGFPLTQVGMVSDVGGMKSGSGLFMIILTDVNNILFVVIVLEILATVLTYLRDRSFALRPFLIIGIISSVRHILIVTANLSAGSSNASSAEHSYEQVVELGVSAVVAVLLVLCYWFVGRTSDRPIS